MTDGTAETELERAGAALAAAGFLAPEDEAAQLEAASAGDGARLDAMVRRRTTGEPLAWITGTTTFCGTTILVHEGVYVPRPQTEAMATTAADRLPADGLAVDLCTGSGAIAVALARRRPQARILAFDVEPAAVRCARANGVDAHEADLRGPRPAMVEALVGRVDVITAVVPYVPTEAMHLLPSDVQAHEPRQALDGGPHGTVLLEQAVEVAAELLRPGGTLLVELGADQAHRLQPALEVHGFESITTIEDEEGDTRSLQATKSPSAT